MHAFLVWKRWLWKEFYSYIHILRDMLFTRTRFWLKEMALGGLLTCTHSYQIYAEFVGDMLFTHTRFWPKMGLGGVIDEYAFIANV